MSIKAFAILIILAVASTALRAQVIHGEALDMETHMPIDGVQIENIHTNVSIPTISDGSFVIGAVSGQLLEFRKQGYKTTRVRIPDGMVPPYFRIIMQRGYVPKPELLVAKTGRERYHDDSITFHSLYEHELNFPKMSAVEKIKSPFSALSARNREIWQFQDDYADFEKEKFVDYVFNEQEISRISGLTGDSLAVYMRRFRPSYEQLRSMNDYQFFTYITATVHRFRTFDTPRSAQ